MLKLADDYDYIELSNALFREAFSRKISELILPQTGSAHGTCHCASPHSSQVTVP
jgi:hypothetical protein